MTNTETNNNIDIPDYNNSEYELHEIQNPDENNLGSEKLSVIQHKTDLMQLTNGWNDKNERIIISIGENAASYKWMHERCANFYRVIQKIMSIILIVFSTGLSAETLLSSDSTETYMIVLQKIFTYIVTLISVLQNFLKYEQLNQQHLVYASDFNQLYHDIQKEMCLYRRDRANATDYVTDILKRYDSLIVNGPNITTRVIQAFKKTFKDSDIIVPDIADKIQKIEIINEPKNTPNGSTSKNFKMKIRNIDNNNNYLQQSTNNYNNSSMCNLQQIHNAFQIHGDITDNDIQNANHIELKELRKKFLKEKQNFEYQRFMQHNMETD